MLFDVHFGGGGASGAPHDCLDFSSLLYLPDIAFLTNEAR